MKDLVCCAILLAACSEDPPESLLEPPAEGHGVQYVMTTTLEPGQETERCKFGVVPAGGLRIQRGETRYTEGSHHALLWRTSYETPPEVVADANGVFDCSDGPFHWGATSLLEGSQSPSAPPLLDLPEGVAMTLPEGAVLLLDVHLLDATAEEVTTEVRLNLHTVDDADVVEEAGTLFWYDLFIRLDPRSRATARMACTIDGDVTLANVQSHMHRRGVGFTSTLSAPAGAPEDLYATDRWADVPVESFQPALPLTAGTTIDFACSYDNQEDRTILQGQTTQDEMCILFGTYWPRSDAIDFCASDGTSDTRFLGATWIGDGTADGEATVQCMVGADGLGGMAGCLQEACPAIAGPVSEVARCFVAGNPLACGRAISDANAAVCD